MSGMRKFFYFVHVTSAFERGALCMWATLQRKGSATEGGRRSGAELHEGYVSIKEEDQVEECRSLQEAAASHR